MKLILTAAVDNLGAPGEVVEVKNGYGRNYLLPRGLAIVATRGAEKQIEGIKRAQEARAIRDFGYAREGSALSSSSWRRFLLRLRPLTRASSSVLLPLKILLLQSRRLAALTWTSESSNCQRV